MSLITLSSGGIYLSFGAITVLLRTVLVAIFVAVICQGYTSGHRTDRLSKKLTWLEARIGSLEQENDTRKEESKLLKADSDAEVQNRRLENETRTEVFKELEANLTQDVRQLRLDYETTTSDFNQLKIDFAAHKKDSDRAVTSLQERGAMDAMAWSKRVASVEHDLKDVKVRLFRTECATQKNSQDLLTLHKHSDEQYAELNAKFQKLESDTQQEVAKNARLYLTRMPPLERPRQRSARQTSPL